MASQILERKKENKRDIERTGRERKKWRGEKNKLVHTHYSHFKSNFLIDLNFN